MTDDCGHQHHDASGPLRELMATMPDHMRADLRMSILADLDAVENMSEGDREEIRSRMKAEAHVRENAAGFVQSSPFGRSVHVRTFPKREQAARWICAAIGAAVGMYVLVPLILSAPILVPFVLGLMLSLALAVAGIAAAYYGFQLYYRSVAKRLAGEGARLKR